MVELIVSRVGWSFRSMTLLIFSSSFFSSAKDDMFPLIDSIVGLICVLRCWIDEVERVLLIISLESAPSAVEMFSRTGFNWACTTSWSLDSSFFSSAREERFVSMSSGVGWMIDTIVCSIRGSTIVVSDASARRMGNIYLLEKGQYFLLGEIFQIFSTTSLTVVRNFNYVVLCVVRAATLASWVLVANRASSVRFSVRNSCMMLSSIAISTAGDSFQQLENCIMD